MDKLTIPVKDYVVAVVTVIAGTSVLVWWFFSQDAALARQFDKEGVTLTATVLEAGEPKAASFGARTYSLQYYDAEGKSYLCGFRLPGYEKLRGNVFEKGQRISIQVLATQPGVCRLAKR